VRDRQCCECLCHFGITAGEEPCHHRAPVVAGEVGGRASEGRNHETHVVREMIDRVALDPLWGIAEAVAAEIGGDSQEAGFSERIDLLRP